MNTRASAEFLDYLVKVDHGSECIQWPFCIGQGWPIFRGRSVCWYILEQTRPDIDSHFRHTHKIHHVCGNRTCVNRGHFYPVSKSKNPSVYDVASDPLLKAWR